MTEFALVAPVLLLLTFGIIDFGRAMFFYLTVGAAASEAARVVVRSTNPPPTTADLQAAVAGHSPGVVVSAPKCPYGPNASLALLPLNGAWVYTGAVSPGTLNAPGGDPPNTVVAGGCDSARPAFGGVPLQVTVVYNFVPATPLVSTAVAGHIIFTLVVQATTEY
ncbi:MAG: hypothetical protein NVS9B1_03030 [Candidatus Dormibacteraceae bacterium]